MAAFATVADLAARWRPLTDDEETIAAALLDDASLRIRLAVPGIDDAILAGSVDPDLPKMVAVSMVKRAMIGGDNGGVSQSSDTAGPFAFSNRYVNPMGDLYLTAAELALLGAKTSYARNVWVQ